jgi:malate synthase
MNQWLAGMGAVAIDNLMEDTATAEISRAQIWQWLRQQCVTAEGAKITVDLYQKLKIEVLTSLIQVDGNQHYSKATHLLDELVLCEQCPDFLTLPAYRFLNQPSLT